MNFKEKLKRILEHEKGLVFPQSTPEKNRTDFKISTGFMNLADNQEEEYMDLLNPPKTDSQEYYPYFNFLVLENNKKICSFTIYGLKLLSQISFLNESHLIAFYNVEDVVYMDCCNLKNVNEVKKMFSSVRLIFKDWNVDIYTVLEHKKKEILFFNGKKFLSIVPRKIIFYEDRLPDYFRLTDIKKISSKCCICEVKEYGFIIEDNPVIPEKYKRVCRDCLGVIEKNNTH